MQIKVSNLSIHAPFFQKRFKHKDEIEKICKENTVLPCYYKLEKYLTSLWDSTYNLKLSF